MKGAGPLLEQYSNSHLGILHISVERPMAVQPSLEALLHTIHHSMQLQINLSGWIVKSQEGGHQLYPLTIEPVLRDSCELNGF